MLGVVFAQEESRRENGETITFPDEITTKKEFILELSNFALPEDFRENKIQNFQLRFSLATKPVNWETNSKLKIEYYYLDSWQGLTEFDLKNEISNKLNGGYLLFGLPIFEKWQDLENLKIRFVFSGNNEDSIVFLDAVWLELEHENFQEELSLEEIEKLPKIKVENLFKNQKRIFKAKDIEKELDC